MGRTNEWNSMQNWNYKCKQKAESIGMELHNMNFNIVSCMLEIKKALMTKYNDNWRRNLNRMEGTRNRGGNKLRTYRTFKVSYGTEQYLKDVQHTRHRSALSKFRCGVAPIRIETGRYENVDVNERTCFRCRDAVESEIHVLLECPLYSNIRDTFYESIVTHIDNFHALDNSDKLSVILNNCDICKISAKYCNDILDRRLSDYTLNMYIVFYHL